MVAAGGDPLCQCELASLHAKGLGTRVDFKQAEMWYSRSAVQGFGAALAGLGIIKLYGCVAGRGDPP
jgi:TPR repeat protein